LRPGLYDVLVSREIPSFYTFSSFVQRFRGIAAGSEHVELALSDDGPDAGEVRIHLEVHGGTPAALLHLTGKLFPREPDSFPKVTAPHELHVSSLANWPAGATYSFSGISGEESALGRWQYGFDGEQGVSAVDLAPMGPGWYVLGVQPQGAGGGHAFFP